MFRAFRTTFQKNCCNQSKRKCRVCSFFYEYIPIFLRYSKTNTSLKNIEQQLMWTLWNIVKSTELFLFFTAPFLNLSQYTLHIVYIQKALIYVGLSYLIDCFFILFFNIFYSKLCSFPPLYLHGRAVVMVLGKTTVSYFYTNIM